MRKRLVLGCLLLAACGISGCGSSPDSLIQEQIKDMNQLAEALETKASQDKINELKKKMEETSKKLEDLKLSDDEKKKLMEKHMDEFTKASTRLVKASMAGEFGKMFEGMPGLPAPGGAPGFPAGLKK